MSADFAEMTIAGRLTSDPKSFPVGKTKKVVFSVAVNRFFKTKDSNDFTKKTTFIDCVAWGNLADRVEKDGKKGSTISATGSWETDEYEKDGSPVRRTQVNIRNIKLFSADGTSPDNDSNDDGHVPF